MDEKRAELASQTSHGCEDAEQRLHTADYVEARGLLLPAVDYLGRAVVQATSKNSLSGSLLVIVSFPVEVTCASSAKSHKQAAEAYMSIGNVSHSRVNRDYFCQAIQYLRIASQIPGFPLPTHLQK